MTTAEALEAMTDVGEFEVLAQRVLRLRDEDCRCLEHCGVNAQGKTVKGPVDSFCRVPGSDPARFVMAAYTTAGSRRLRDKWLREPSAASRRKTREIPEDGDLVKASREADNLRSTFHDSTFVVYLCTNRRLEMDLWKEVCARGAQLGLEVRFLCQSLLRDSLDTTGEGQWLRKTHLRIDADLFSLSLMRELSSRSLTEYGKFLAADVGTFVPTSAQIQLRQSTDDGAPSIHILCGPSGFGKSVAAYQTLRDHLTAGGVGIWIPGEIAARDPFLSSAIYATVAQLYPSVEPAAGNKALDLPVPLLVVVDDVNRAPAPSDTLRKVLGWGRPQVTESAQPALGSAQARTSVIVPAWRGTWAPLEPEFREKNWVSIVQLGPMLEDEAIACLSASLGASCASLGAEGVRRLSHHLGCDPFLIARFAELPTTTSTATPAVAVDSIMDGFVDAAVEVASNSRALPCELREALLAVTRVMIEGKELYPTWERAKSSIDANQREGLRALVLCGHLCRVTTHAGPERFEFRHDRILEHFLTLVLGEMLTDPEKNAVHLVDPFFAEYVGRALCRTPAPEDLLQWLRMQAPLALVAGIGYLTGNDPYAKRIARHGTIALAEMARSGEGRSAMLFESYRLLKQTDSPLVLSLTEGLPSHWLLTRARLANGDATAAIAAFNQTSLFEPSVTDTDLDGVLARGLHGHRQALVEACRRSLEWPGTGPDRRVGGLVLAGFLGAPELATAISALWMKSQDRDSLLVPGIWAACRCGGEDPGKLLAPMLKTWEAVSDTCRADAIIQRSPRAEIAEHLRFAMRRGIGEPVVRCLIDYARSNESLRAHIALLLWQVGHPLAVRFFAEEAGAIARKLTGPDQFSPWIMGLASAWDALQTAQGRQLSRLEIDAIRSCWDGPGDRVTRGTAFRLWTRATTDLDALQAIDDAHFGFKGALWKRAQLGDRTATPAILPLLQPEFRWFQVVPRIWSTQFLCEADKALETLKARALTDSLGVLSNDHHFLADLLRDIPIGDAEPLLVKHWEHLRCSPVFVQAALYLGTQRTRALAGAALSACPSGASMLEYVQFYFGFRTVGLCDRLSSSHLESLRPHITLLTGSALSEIAAFCKSHGFRDWGRSHIRPEIHRRLEAQEFGPPDERSTLEHAWKYHYPSDGDLQETLSEIEGHKHWEHLLWDWCEEFARRGDDHLAAVLEGWLALAPTISRYRIVAAALGQEGTRVDLRILEGSAVADDQDGILSLAANARFSVMRRSLR